MYAQRYLQALDKPAEAQTILGDFFKEVSMLAHLRQIVTLEDLHQILDELIFKYRVYIRMINWGIPDQALRLSENGFSDILNQFYSRSEKVLVAPAGFDPDRVEHLINKEY